jgi:hypothetical protein
VSIYEELKEAGVPVDSHESDLYAKVTPVSRGILARYPKQSRSCFTSRVDKTAWFDIPFAYDPWWKERLG